MILPAGLENKSVEIYLYEGEVHALYGGKAMHYFELPEHIREPFQAELIADKVAQQCLTEVFRIASPDDMELKFAACRYGNWDKNPDLVDGKPVADVPNCSQTRTCPGFGIICLLPEGPGGKLSKQLYHITQLIGLGKLDKEIAAELNITLPTVRTHLTRIREKLAVNNRIEIALWAQKKGIV